MECVNLLECFGRRFRIGFEDGYTYQHVPRRCLDPWMMLIPCRHGHIGPWGGELLVACTSKRGGVARALAVLDCVQVVAPVLTKRI
jgi:hypothetical protein